LLVTNFSTDLKQHGGERVLYLQKEKLRDISVSLKNPFWSDVLLCLSEAKPHTDSSVNDILLYQNEYLKGFLLSNI
jgi:hypothetical protein